MATAWRVRKEAEAQGTSLLSRTRSRRRRLTVRRWLSIPGQAPCLWVTVAVVVVVAVAVAHAAERVGVAARGVPARRVAAGATCCLPLSAFD